MVQEISDFYKEKRFTKVYINTNKEPRRVATLRKANKEMISMSYAKYLYTSYYKVDIPKENHVDHKHREMVLLKCPVCNKEFLFAKRNLSSHPNPCCSRKCGGIKSHW